MIVEIFDQQVILILPSTSNGLPVQEKKFKIDFQDGGHDGHLGFLLGKILDTGHIDTSHQISSQLDFPFRRRGSK